MTPEPGSKPGASVRDNTGLQLLACKRLQKPEQSSSCDGSRLHPAPEFRGREDPRCPKVPRSPRERLPAPLIHHGSLGRVCTGFRSSEGVWEPNGIVNRRGGVERSWHHVLTDHSRYGMFPPPTPSRRRSELRVSRAVPRVPPRGRASVVSLHCSSLERRSRRPSRPSVPSRPGWSRRSRRYS